MYESGEGVLWQYGVVSLRVTWHKVSYYSCKYILVGTFLTKD